MWYEGTIQLDPNGNQLMQPQQPEAEQADSQGEPEKLAEKMVAPRVAQQVEAQPIAIVFAQTPAHATGANLLNYMTNEGQQLYHDACAPLVDKFDGEPQNSSSSFHALKIRQPNMHGYQC